MLGTIDVHLCICSLVYVCATAHVSMIVRNICVYVHAYMCVYLQRFHDYVDRNSAALPWGFYLTFIQDA